MNYTTYFREQFPADLQRLQFKKPSNYLQKESESFRIDDNTIYFGGKDWENLEQDIRHISKGNRSFFCMSLFTITTIDLTFFTHFQEHYQEFRNKTNYPKFGWSGFGPHYENPRKLIEIPLEKGLIDRTDIEANLKEYIELFVEECDRFFTQMNFPFSTSEFIDAFLNDKAFIISEEDTGTMIELILRKMKSSKKSEI